MTDLGSRNRTTVDDIPLPIERPKRLWHGQMLRIGSRRFRVSLRDAQTRQPHRPPGLLSDDPLMSELDELANTIATDGPIALSPVPTDPDPSSGAETELTISDDPRAHEQSPTVDDVDRYSKEPMREIRGIPGHLRPPGPVDSKAAANEALRRLFSR